MQLRTGRLSRIEVPVGGEPQAQGAWIDSWERVAMGEFERVRVSIRRVLEFSEGMIKRASQRGSAPVQGRRLLPNGRALHRPRRG